MLFERVKPLDQILATAEKRSLKRQLGAFSLTMLGVGAIIGTGIFVLTGQAAAANAGPAIVLSMVLAGLTSVLAALCYSEFASSVPVAGSAYTYAYATLGELVAWIIGWDLILEYAMACACVAAAWGNYLQSFLNTAFGVEIPWWLANDPFSTPGAWFNLPAVAIMLVITMILIVGIRESAGANAILTVVKLAVVLFVIAVGATLSNFSTGEQYVGMGAAVTGRIMWEHQRLANGYSLVLEASSGALLYADKAVDVTDEIVKLHNASPHAGTRGSKSKE